MVKAQQIPTAAISQGSQPSLPPINLGSPSSSGSKPKSKTSQLTQSKSKAKSKAPAAPAQPKDHSRPKSQIKAKAKSILPPAQPTTKSKVKPKLSRDELLQLARQITDQAEAQSASSSAHSEEGSDSAHSSEESTNQYSGPEFQDAQDLIMESFGFGQKWRSWIKSCVTTARISMLVNGSPTTEFKSEKGLIPSPIFLFNLVVEGLNMLTMRATKLGFLKGVEIGKDLVKVSHL
ncbi:uncharacterized protein LOC114307573 [Camellia sinensis]|uniref:uncharacterized protein LOC114307573 n=1 Tax=Camellia sinensis TaxID=4442 RepID=UPI001036C0B9|nr:uncharacterized protein LOC114307573 [Camellia sinensis]